jgi:hypothetical protein
MAGLSDISLPDSEDSIGDCRTVAYETRAHIRGAALYHGGKMKMVGSMPYLEELVEVLNSFTVGDDG